jgi:hypothetical protein
MSSQEQKLVFKDLNKFISENNSSIFIVNSYTNAGKFDSYCAKYIDIMDILIYIKERYLAKPDDTHNRNIKILSYDTHFINILQTTTYDKLVSFKNYYIYNKDNESVEIFLEAFNNTKFR